MKMKRITTLYLTPKVEEVKCIIEAGYTASSGYEGLNDPNNFEM